MGSLWAGSPYRVRAARLAITTESRGGSRGRVQGVRTPPAKMNCGFLIQLAFCKKKNYVVYWCWSRAREECNPSNKKSLIRPWRACSQAIIVGPGLTLFSWQNWPRNDAWSNVLFHALLTQHRVSNSDWNCWTQHCKEQLRRRKIKYYNRRWIKALILWRPKKLAPTDNKFRQQFCTEKQMHVAKQRDGR